MSVLCEGASCGADVPIAEFGALPVGQWQTVGVLLKCFRAAGADMTQITAPFRLTTSDAAQFSLSRIALGSLSEADVIAQCPTE